MDDDFVKRFCYYVPEFQNRSHSQADAIFANDIAMISINILAIILSVCANGFVVYTYLRSRSRQPVSNTLLFLLATFDLLQGIVSQPVYIAAQILELHVIFNCNVLAISSIVAPIFAGFPFVMVTFVVTSERLFAVVYPIRHRVYMRRKRMIAASLLLFVIWVTIMVSLLQTSPSAFGNVFFGVYTLGLIYSLAAYTKMYCVIKKSAAFRESKKTTSSMINHATSESNESYELQVSSKKPEKRREFTVAAELERDDYTSSISEDGISGRANQDKVLENVVESSNEQYNCNNYEASAITTSRTNETIQLEFEDNFSDSEKKSPCRKAEEHSKNNIQRVQSVSGKTCAVRRKEKKTIVRMLCILSALYLCNIPLICYLTVLSLEGFKFVLVRYFLPWSITFYFSATIVNPFIYCYKNEHFWNRKSKKPDSHRNTNMSSQDSTQKTS